MVVLQHRQQEGLMFIVQWGRLAVLGPAQQLAALIRQPGMTCVCCMLPVQVTTDFWQSEGAMFPSEVAFIPRGSSRTSKSDRTAGSVAGSTAGSTADVEDDGWLISVVSILSHVVKNTWNCKIRDHLRRKDSSCSHTGNPSCSHGPPAEAAPRPA